MRFRFLILWFAAILTFSAALPPAASALATPTEATAIAAANNDHTAYTLPPDKLAKAIEISEIADPLVFIRDIWGIVSLFLILQFGLAARIRNVAVNLSGNRWAQAFTFVLLFFLLYTVVNLPLKMYGHHEGVKYGFSVQHWGSWFGDQAKSFLMSDLLLSAFAMLLFWIIRKFPRRWWLWLWFPSMAIAMFLTYISPWVVDPMFNKFEPLGMANPALVDQIEKVATHGGIDIPPERMFLMKASAKTTTLNAYVTGFGASKRLVVWDTLLAKGTPDEISLIAGHEMGHYVLGHIVRGMLLGFVGMLAAFFVAFQVFQFLLHRFGTRWGIASQDDWASLVVMLLVMSTLLFFSEPIQNSFSRGMEHDADIFGQEAVHGVVANPQAAGQAAFQLLGENTLTAPNPNPFVDFWTDSHPSIPFRAAFAKHYDPWAPGEEPKYFKK
jgi:Zn-dependent protease with chaperone function